MFDKLVDVSKYNGNILQDVLRKIGFKAISGCGTNRAE